MKTTIQKAKEKGARWMVVGLDGQKISAGSIGGLTNLEAEPDEDEEAPSSGFKRIPIKLAYNVECERGECEIEESKAHIAGAWKRWYSSSSVLSMRTVRMLLSASVA